jgi:hypothetical protein
MAERDARPRPTTGEVLHRGHPEAHAGAAGSDLPHRLQLQPPHRLVLVADVGVLGVRQPDLRAAGEGEIFCDE